MITLTSNKNFKRRELYAKSNIWAADLTKMESLFSKMLTINAEYSALTKRIEVNSKAPIFSGYHYCTISFN